MQAISGKDLKFYCIWFFYKRHPSKWLRKHSYIFIFTTYNHNWSHVDLFKTGFFSSNVKLLKKGIAARGKTPLTRSAVSKTRGDFPPSLYLEKKPCTPYQVGYT